MEKKRVEDHEVETAPRVKVDKFGFVKPDQNSPEPGFIKSKSALEFERYSFFIFFNCQRHMSSLLLFWKITCLFLSRFLLPLQVKSSYFNYSFMLSFVPCYSANKQVVFREERRIRKWRKMIGVGGSDWKHYTRRKPHVVKRRIRKGIPDCLRGLVWQLISGSRDLLLLNPGVYKVINYILQCLICFDLVIPLDYCPDLMDGNVICCSN